MRTGGECSILGKDEEICQAGRKAAQKEEEMIQTQRLYYENVYCREFEAVVLDCRKQKDGYALLLDKSAFTRRAADSQAIRDTLAK